MRVLVVEDQSMLADAIQAGLRLEAIAADVAGDGRSALELADVHRYDVVVLDRDLPVVHGDDVCRYLVTSEHRPAILMLTAIGEVTDRIEGLGIGADDYLVKPFDFDELVARIRALHRRPNRALPPQLHIGDVRLDPFTREAYRRDRYLHLTRKEFAVLEVLMRAGGGVVSAEQLLEEAWDVNADPFTNAVRITVSTLRKKLGQLSPLTTVPGSGYRMRADNT